MKKVLFALGAFGFMATAAADEVENVAAADEHPAYEGFYAGFGFHAANVGEKSEYTNGSLYADGTPHGHPEVIGWTDEEVASSRTRLGGSVVFGFGKKLRTNIGYIGIEGGLDFAPNSEESRISIKSNATDRAYDTEVNRRGLTPWLGVRLGAIDCETKILTYVKVGGSVSKSVENYWEYAIVGDVNPKHSRADINTVTPIVALGIEKAFARKMSGRLELEYKFKKSKTKDYGAGGSLKFTQKDAITLRALFCYHVKIGI